ncbi:MAG: hypothetical protein KF718_15040 [Polyangiaceae bacterium]|nr:hypothetical protein [Polyangiaceae bacterium]
MTRVTLLTTACLLGSLLAACDEKKPAPAPALDEPTDASAEKPKRADDDDDDEPKVVARPPGWVPPEDAGVDAGREPRTGICSFNESGYDGMDTKSNEKLVVRIKEETIVAAEYTYRGSYALDGKAPLSIPLQERKWLEFELPMTSGSKTFTVRVKSNVMDIKGTAAKDAQGNCAWEDLDRKDKRRMKRK